MENYFNDGIETKANKEEGAAEQRNLTLQDVFNAGVKAGMKHMMDKIERQCQLGKPILVNGSLYWLKNDMENLRDIMDDMEEEYRESKADGIN